MNCNFLWVQRLIFNEFMAFCKSVINHSVITVSSHLSHPFQYLHYEGTMVNSNTTIAIISAGLSTQRLQEWAVIGWSPQQRVGSLEGLQTSDRYPAINLLTTTRVVFVPLFVLPCISVHAAGLSCHMSQLCLSYGQHGGKVLRDWIVTVIFATLIWRETLLTGRWLTLETLTTLRLADHRCCVCMQRTTVFIVLGST